MEQSGINSIKSHPLKNVWTIHKHAKDLAFDFNIKATTVLCVAETNKIKTKTKALDLTFQIDFTTIRYTQILSQAQNMAYHSMPSTS